MQMIWPIQYSTAAQKRVAQNCGILQLFRAVAFLCQLFLNITYIVFTQTPFLVMHWQVFREFCKHLRSGISTLKSRGEFL